MYRWLIDCQIGIFKIFRTHIYTFCNWIYTLADIYLIMDAISGVHGVYYPLSYSILPLFVMSLPPCLM